MFAAFTLGDAEYGSVPTQEQTSDSEETIIFSPGNIEEGDNGSYF